MVKYTLGKFENGYNYSGTEKERIQDLNWALNNPEISAIWASKRWLWLSAFIETSQTFRIQRNPKWYIGYSDNTVINSYLLKNNFASYSRTEPLKQLVSGVSEGSYEDIFKILEGKKIQYSVEKHQLNKNGKTEGELIGGNLALIYALLGTPYSFDFKDKILFIEDIGENFYALDRMLISLDLAGVFRKIKGLIIGGMTNMGDAKENKNYEEPFDEFAYEIIAQRIKKYNFPTLFGFPNGHIFDNRPLIIGSKVKMEVEEKGLVKIL